MHTSALTAKVFIPAYVSQTKAANALSFAQLYV